MLKNLALPHQLVVYKRTAPGPVRRWMSLFVWAERLGGQEHGGWVLYRIVNGTRTSERHSKASVVRVAQPTLPPLSGLILSCKWLIGSALIDHSSCSSVVPGRAEFVLLTHGFAIGLPSVLRDGYRHFLRAANLRLLDLGARSRGDQALRNGRTGKVLGRADVSQGQDGSLVGWLSANARRA
jgi:hypothetical protein